MCCIWHTRVKTPAAPDASQFGGANEETQQRNNPAKSCVGFANAPPSEDFMERFNGYIDNLINTDTNKKAVLEKLIAINTELSVTNSRLSNTNAELSATNSKLNSDLRKLRKQLNAAIKK